MSLEEQVQVLPMKSLSLVAFLVLALDKGNGDHALISFPVHIDSSPGSHRGGVKALYRNSFSKASHVFFAECRELLANGHQPVNIPDLVSYKEYFNKMELN